MTLAHISHDAGIHVASVIQLFKTKENRIVTIPERHPEETPAGITEHLQGMKGAKPKIRKLICHQLRNLSVNKDYPSMLPKMAAKLHRHFRNAIMIQATWREAANILLIRCSWLTAMLREAVIRLKVRSTV